MKAKLKYGLGGYSGKLDDMVFYQERQSEAIIARRYVKPSYSKENERLGLCTRRILSLQPSEAYKNDLRSYLLWYQNSKAAKLKPLRSWVNLFIHLMYRLAKAYPGLDLKTITREHIYTDNLPCISIKRAVEAGLLVPVQGWEKMDAPI